MARLKRVTVGAAALVLGLIGVETARAQHPPRRHGVVVDESGAAVPGAQVTVRTARGALLADALTDADGSFVFEGLPSGSYSLDVTARAFESRRVRFDLDAASPDPLRVVLGLAPLQSEITVTAERGAVADLERAAPIVTVRTADDFRSRPLATIGNALDGATGVMVQQSASAQASPFLRGLTGYQVLNLIDGIRLNNTTFRSGPNQYLAFIDPSQGERIEAMLGPASAQFGSDAMGGAIQVLTPPARFSTSGAWALTGALDLFAGSADETRAAAGSIFIRGRNLTGMAGASHRRLGDLRAGNGSDSHHVLRRLFGLDDDQIEGLLGARQVDTGFTQSAVYAKGAARLGAGQTLTAWYQRSDQDEVRGYKDLWGGLGRIRSDFDPQRLQLLYARYERLDLAGLDWLSATFSVNGQDDGSVRQNLRPVDPIVRDAVGADAYGYTVQAGVHAGARHTLVFGGEVYDEHVTARRDETNPVTGVTLQKRALYPNGSRYLTTGLFLQDQVDVWRGDHGRGIVARVGGRFTRVDVRTDADANRSDAGESLGVVDAEDAYQDWTFNTSLTVSLSRTVSVHGLVGRGFRAPNLNDLGALGLNDLGYEVPASSSVGAGASIGASDGEGVLSTGRAVAELESERLMNYELGVALNHDRFYLRVQGFDAELRAPIVRRTLVFPAAAPPSTLAGVPVAPLAQTAAQREQGVVSVATSVDPRAVKAFVNEGSARYSGVEATGRYRLAARWSVDARYSYLAGHDLSPTRPVRRLPPQQGMLALRYRPGGVLSWIEASALVSGAQDELSGGDLTDERIGAARRRSDITDFFRGGRIGPYLQPGVDGLAGAADDVFGPTGETLAQIRDRVLPLGATINGVTIVDDGVRVPLYTKTPGFVTLNLRTGLTLTPNVGATVALMNLLDRSYRVHGSGLDAPGRSLFAGLSFSF